MGGLTIENNFFILKIEKRNKIIVFDFQKVGAGAQKSGGAAALPAIFLSSAMCMYIKLQRFTHQSYNLKILMHVI